MPIMSVIRRSLWLVLIGSALPLCAAPPGTVVAWGRNDYGQTNVPAGLNDVIAIAAGGAHTVVLRSDGTVVAWGRNDHGQTDVPAGLAGVTAGSVSAALGAFALAPGSLDAALFQSGIALGSYTLQVAGKSAQAGVALAEIYDATTSSATTKSRLVNLSARGPVDDGGNDVVAGFVLSGGGST
jgi:predicted cobalt transporter CbtA